MVSYVELRKPIQKHHATVDDESGIGNWKGSTMPQYDIGDMVKFKMSNEEAIGEILDINPSAPLDYQGPTWYLIRRTDKEQYPPRISVHESNVLQKIEET